MANLMDDYSGPVKEDLNLADFSREFLEKLAYEWAASGVRVAGIWQSSVEERLGREETDALETKVFNKSAKIHLPKIAKLANIEVKDLGDVYKLIQLNFEGIMLFQPFSSCEFVNGNRNHLIFTVHRCKNLENFEKHAPERISHICQYMEEACMRGYINVFFDDVEVNPLKLPPRKSPDEIACQFEWKRTA